MGMNRLEPPVPSSRTRVLTACRQRIVSGQWPPGYILQEKLLASELGVSKTPVREALQYLAFVGVVTPHNRVGYVVAPIDVSDMIDVFHFRTMIEEELVYQVAAYPEFAWSPPLSQAAPIEVELEFHRRLYAQVASVRMTDTLSLLLDETARASAYAQLPDTLLKTLAADHGPILDAVLAHDAALARALVVVHLRHWRDSLLAILRQKLRETKNVL